MNLGASDCNFELHCRSGICPRCYLVISMVFSIIQIYIIHILLYLNPLFLSCKNGLLLSFSGETTYPHQAYWHTMAGVFELIKRPQKRLVGHHGVVQRADPRALELQAAMDILAEVFSITPAEVEEMIQSRFKVSHSEAISSKENVLWPQELWIEE